MIRKLLLGSLILFTGFNFAQNYQTYGPHLGFWGISYADKPYNDVLMERKVIRDNHVKKRERIRYYKGEPTSTTEYFDLAGRLVKTEREFRNGTTGKTVYRYNENGNLVEFKSINAKNKEAITTYTYDDQGRQITWEAINYKEQYSANKVAFNANGKLAYRRIYEKDKETPKKELVYFYYDNGDPKLTEYYLKGKLIHSWNYDCKPEGELINVKNKNATTLCKIEEIDSTGNRVVWERKFDEKGKLSKTKTVYFSDSLKLSSQRYNSADKLTSETFYFYDLNNKRTRMESWRFDKNDTKYLKFKITYSKKYGNQTVSYHKNGKIDYTAENQRDENNRLIKSQHLDGRWSHTYLYNYKNDLIRSEVRIHKNNTYVSEYVYDYY